MYQTNHAKGIYRKSPQKREGKRRTLETMGYRDLVKVLDKEISLYVRLSAVDANGIVRCVTCGERHHWKEITLGHYISRTHHSVRWNLKNLGCQCRACNSYHGGEQYKMRQYLVERYGEKEIEAVEERADMTKTETADSLRMMVIEVREAVKQLKIEKGL